MRGELPTFYDLRERSALLRHLFESLHQRSDALGRRFTTLRSVFEAAQAQLRAARVFQG